MKTTPFMAIMSHLSDAQELIEFGCKDEARQQINLSKMILSEFSDKIQEPQEWSEYDKLWKICQERFGSKC